jgi:hypothetical protein
MSFRAVGSDEALWAYSDGSAGLISVLGFLIPFDLVIEFGKAAMKFLQDLLLSFFWSNGFHT